MFYSSVFVFLFFSVHGTYSEQQIYPEIDKITNSYKLLPISKSIRNDKVEAIETSNNEAVTKEYLHCNDKFTEFPNSIHKRSE